MAKGASAEKADRISKKVRVGRMPYVDQNPHPSCSERLLGSKTPSLDPVLQRAPRAGHRLCELLENLTAFANPSHLLGRGPHHQGTVQNISHHHNSRADQPVTPDHVSTQ